MRAKLHVFLLLVLVFMIENTQGKKNNKTKSLLNNYKPHSSKVKNISNRIKRSLEGNDGSFWPQKRKRLSLSSKVLQFRNEINGNSNGDTVDKEPPFWGTRGRRGSSYMDTYMDGLKNIGSKSHSNNCKYCSNPSFDSNYGDFGYVKERRDDFDVPFWGNRGRRNSVESLQDKYLPELFWGNRGRRYEDEPFWGSRGRRQEDVPFWGNRGRRHHSKSQDQSDEFKPNRARKDFEPFWGNHGQRENLPLFNENNDESPFWGNRGRRQDVESFWGNRGRRENEQRQKESLKKVLLDAISKVEDNIESLIRTRREDSSNSFWNSRGRSSQLINIFKSERARYKPKSFMSKNVGLDSKPSEASTVLDDRIFAEQPHFIIVERSSRSSAEEDPFFISRGKKMFFSGYGMTKAVRDRRGAIEELVKSVRNDPYYIARGKKDTQGTKVLNSTNLRKELGKTKELICATIDLILNKTEGTIKTKRDINDNERDRRTILKKLAAQLQMDPYFVSRGKRSESHEDNLDDFLNDLSTKCN